MRRKIAFANLFVAFFTSTIVVFVPHQKPTMASDILVRDNRDFLRSESSPDEVIVKFKNAAAITLEEQTSAGPSWLSQAETGFDVAQLELSGSLDKFNEKFPLITPKH